MDLVGERNADFECVGVMRRLECGEAGGDWRVGILSDTHGLLRPEVLAAVAGCDQILHAGDVGTMAVLEALRAVAPVTAIRGNVDVSGPLAALPATEMVRLGAGGPVAYLVHAVGDLDLDPVAAGVSVVVSGHSHKASEAWRDGVLYLNPGSVGARRFKLPVSMAFLVVRGGEWLVEMREFLV